MLIKELHKWDVSPGEAKRIQIELKRYISFKNSLNNITKIAGADVSFSKKSNKGKGAIVILSFPEFNLIEKVELEKELKFPYIPGLLTFREGPILIEAFMIVKEIPDIVLFDGQGVAHPRRMGIATHMGILFDLPAIGCAKNLLFGNYEEPEKTRGSQTQIYDKDEIIGVALRTRSGVKPIFVSPGNKIDLESSVRVVLGSTPNFRIPLPLRLAHTLSKKGIE